MFWLCAPPYCCCLLCRASQGEKPDNTFDSQVVQYEPAHQGSINTVTNLTPDLCVSGGSDQVVFIIHYHASNCKKCSWLIMVLNNLITYQLLLE